MKVVITIPAYNESKTIGSVLKEIKEVMEKTHYDYRLQVVDDGSTDKTVKIAKEAGATVFSHPANMGLAEAFRTEIQKALSLGADIIVHTDADGQYQAEDIPKLIKAVEDGNDLVLGDRFAGGIESMPWLKKTGNNAFSRVISKIIHSEVHDCQTGFRAFTKEVAKNVPITSTHTYTQEQIIRTFRQKYKIKEIPTYFSARDGKSRLMSNPFGYAIRAWFNILRIQRDHNPMKFFGGVGIFFIIIGFIIGIWLLTNFLRTGIVGHLPSTILCGLLIMSGLQILFFGFLADMRK